MLRRRSTSPISYEVMPARILVRYVNNIRWLYLLAAGMVAHIGQSPTVATGVAVVKNHLDFIPLAREHRLLLSATRAASGTVIEDLQSNPGIRPRSIAAARPQPPARSPPLPARRRPKHKKVPWKSLVVSITKSNFETVRTYEKREAKFLKMCPELFGDANVL